ncbi:hypothetical protein MY8738_003079 [Beauveria namnaoensis]
MSDSQDSSSLSGARSAVKTPLLIPGRGDPVKDAILVFSAGKIDYAGPLSGLPTSLSVPPERTVDVPVLLPGLWDCHVHYIGHLEQSMAGMADPHPFLAGTRTVHDIAATLNAGFTSVRETAGWGAELSQEIDAGRLIGPNIYSVCAAISCTGGHVDHHTMPEHHFHELGCRGLPLVVADGVPQCIKVVRQQLRRGAKCIKICTSGGVSSDRDDPRHQQFSDEEIRAMVEEAARSQRALAAHAHGKPGIMAAVRNGATTVEHGVYLDDEAIALMKEKGTILVPTRSIVEDGLATAESWSTRAYEKLQQVALHHAHAYRSAVAAGIKIASGSDYGISKRGTPLSHGHNGRELELAVQVGGMTPLQAIEAATATAPEVLGPQAPQSGILTQGYDADFIALASNPLDDISIIADPDNVTHVWLGGSLKKSPERPIMILNRTKPTGHSQTLVIILHWTSSYFTPVYGFTYWSHFLGGTRWFLLYDLVRSLQNVQHMRQRFIKAIKVSVAPPSHPAFVSRSFGHWYALYISRGPHKDFVYFHLDTAAILVTSVSIFTAMITNAKDKNAATPSNVTNAVREEIDKEYVLVAHIQASPSSVVTLAEKRLLRKIDFRVLPIPILLVGLSSIDRVNISSAKVAGMAQDLNLGGARYNIAVLAFFTTYALSELPSNLLVRPIGPVRYLSILLLLWGTVATCLGLVQNFAQLTSLRVLLGLFEGGLNPACVYLISSWYKRYETHRRIAIWYTLAGIIAGFAGVISYGCSKLEGLGGLRGWRWIFIVPGLITIACVLLVYFFASEFPENAKWLNPDELNLVRERLQQDRAEILDDSATLRESFASLKDWRVWAMAMLYFYIAAAYYALAFFTPTILSAFGFSVALSQILQTPPYIFASICSVATGYYADKLHRRAPFMYGHAAVVIGGFLLMGWGPDTGGKLTGVFLSIAGIQCIIPTVLTFMSNNIVSVKDRKVAIALQIVVGAIGGLVGSLIFRPQDAPTYRPGMYAAFALIVLFLVNVFVVTEYFRRQNKKANEAGLIIDGVVGFRYTL